MVEIAAEEEAEDVLGVVDEGGEEEAEEAAISIIIHITSNMEAGMVDRITRATILNKKTHPLLRVETLNLKKAPPGPTKLSNQKKTRTE